jgi:DNA uptake protein ComE-like DNA-binding protein
MSAEPAPARDDLATLKPVTDAPRDSASPASAWLPEGARRRAEDEARKRPRGSATTAEPASDELSEVLERADSKPQEWLLNQPGAPAPAKPKSAPEKPQRNGARAEPVPPTAEPAKPEPPKVEPAKVEPPKVEPSRELEEARAELADQRARIAELEEALRKREAELNHTLEEREAEFAQALRERDEALKEREAELEEQLSLGYEKREADLNRQFDRRQVELEKQLAVLEDRLNSRETELRDRATQREAKLMTRIEELQSQLADAKLGMSETPAPKRSRGSRKDGTLDLNIISFEQLRELGLSVTQSARVIAYRDTRGGFDSLDELDEIPGLPKDTRVALTSRLHL